MATHPIYIETEEEIPEVVERLRKAMADEVRLVLPLRSRLGQSRFNFELLKRYASQFGKRVMIVSADPAVQQMAQETGFQATGVDFEPAGTAAVAAAAVPAPVRPGTAPAPPAVGPKISVVAPQKLPSKQATAAHPGRFLLGTGISLVLMVSSIGAVLYTPQAKVTLYAKAVQYKVPDIEVNAEPGKPPIKVRTATVQKTASQGVRTTGEKTVPGVQATGTVSWYNKCPAPISFDILTGQRVTGGGQEFAVISGTTRVNGNSRVATDIKAVRPGQAGNVGSIDDFQGGGTYERACLSVSGGPTGGGQDEKHETTVAAADIDAARGQLEQQLRKEIGEDLIHQQGQGEKLGDTIAFATPDFNPDHKVGDVSSGVGGTMTLKGEGAFYSEAEVIKEIQAQMVKRIPQDQVLTDNKISVDYRLKSAAPGGHLSFLGNAVGYIAPKLNFEQIKSRLAGKSTSQASSYLKSLPIDHAEVKMSPVQLPLMPLLSSRIDINYKVKAQPADKAPTPSPKPT